MGALVHAAPSRPRALAGLPATGSADPNAVAAESVADRWLDEVGPYEIDRWLRQEHLVEDLVTFLRESAGLTPGEEADIRAVGRVNVRHARRLRLRQSLTPEQFFSEAQIAKLYAGNPRWAAIEQRVYR